MFGNIFSSKHGIPFLSISEESPLNSSAVTEILLCLYKQFVSYDRTKTEKNQQFFALAWLIFAGPVTYMLSVGTYTAQDYVLLWLLS